MKPIFTRLGAPGLVMLALASQSLAGSPEPAPVETPVFTPVAVAPSGEWTGFYGGLQFGTADIEGDAGLLGDDNGFGLYAGYDDDLGSFVLGADVDATTFSLRAGFRF